MSALPPFRIGFDYWTRERAWRLITAGVIVFWMIMAHFAYLAYTNWG